MKKFSFGRFFVFIILGLIIGTALGIFISRVFPVFDYGINVGIPNVNLDLIFLKLGLNLEIKLNIGTIIGLILFVLFFTLT